MLDGAGRFRILFSIMLPLIKATLATVILYYVIGNWNAWFNAMIYLRDRTKFPLQLILKEILISGNTEAAGMENSVSGGAADYQAYSEAVKYATIIASTIPVLCIYPFLQRFFVKGVMLGAIKG